VNSKLSIDRATLRRFRAVLHQAEHKGVQGLHWQGGANLLDALAGYANFVSMVDSARGQPLVQRVQALRTQGAQKADSSVAAPVRPSRLSSGSFRAGAAAGQAPWPDWWQPAEAPAPVLEKTAEQIAAGKRAEREARRKAARPQTATAAPTSADARPSALVEGNTASPGERPWRIALAAQIVFTLLLGRGFPILFYMAVAVIVFNAVRRQAGWKRYFLALAAGWLLGMLLR
jgi:hypothetical protein